MTYEAEQVGRVLGTLVAERKLRAGQPEHVAVAGSHAAAAAVWRKAGRRLSRSPDVAEFMQAYQDAFEAHLRAQPGIDVGMYPPDRSA